RSRLPRDPASPPWGGAWARDRRSGSRPGKEWRGEERTADEPRWDRSPRSNGLVGNQGCSRGRTLAARAADGQGRASPADVDALYSARSATIGSTLVARSAGSHAAITAESPRITVTPMNVGGSVALTPNNTLAISRVTA